MVKKWVIGFSKHTIDHKALKMKGSYAFSLRVEGILCPWITHKIRGNKISYHLKE